jgi:UDP-N-acetylmuramoyl-tripeptide--D-alanyl-D-alanine ligase
MRRRTVEGLAEELGGALRAERQEGALVTGVVVDSRRAGPGDVFFALPGERSDGHSFVSDALDRGAAAAVVRRGREIGPGSPGGEQSFHQAAVIDVEDPSRALLDLARGERTGLRATVVGITGSTGKTCTKDLTAAVLAQRLRVVASPASFNNEVGLPLTILRATEETEVVVCEMGSRGLGHIRLLCDVARPSVGVVTNVGVAHMELFGSPDVLREAKAELPESLPPDGIAVLNADDPVVRGYASRSVARTVLFGSAPSADIRAESVSMAHETGAARFRLATPDGAADVALGVPGEHMVSNALAAAAVGWAMQVPAEEVAAGLQRAAVTGGRMEVHRTPGGVRVVDDAYNANPASMAAALRAARWMAGRGRCIAVLGPMAELGPIARDEHLRVGELLVRLGIHAVVVVGEEARMIAAGAEREGLEPGSVHFAADVQAAIEVVRSLAGPGDLVLVKASRVAGLERVVEGLLGSPEGARA